MGKNVTVNCGSWTTYYRKEIWDDAAGYCSRIGSGGGGGTSSNTTAQVAAFGGGGSGRK